MKILGYCQTCIHYDPADMSKVKKSENKDPDNFHVCKRHNKPCYSAINRGCGKFRSHWTPNTEKMKKVIHA